MCALSLSPIYGEKERETIDMPFLQNEKKKTESLSSLIYFHLTDFRKAIIHNN